MMGGGSERSMIGMYGRRGSVPNALPVSDLSAGINRPRTRTMSISGTASAGGLPLPLSASSHGLGGSFGGNSGGGRSRRESFDWDAGFEFSTTEGTGVSACEEAGYIFGAQENGVRGKAGTPGFWAPEMVRARERDSCPAIV